MVIIIRKLPTADQRAVGYLGVAEALLDREAAGSAKVQTDQ
jgi:hypothetical protein